MKNVSVKVLIAVALAAVSFRPARAIDSSPPVAGDSYYDIDELSRTLSSVLLLSYCRNGGGLPADDVQAIAATGTRLLVIGHEISTRSAEDVNDEEAWYGLRAEMLGHIMMAVLSNAEGSAEAAKRHLIEANHVYDVKMFQDDKRRGLTTTNTIKWRRLVHVPLALIAHQCGDHVLVKGYCECVYDGETPAALFYQLEAQLWARRAMARSLLDTVKASKRTTDTASNTGNLQSVTRNQTAASKLHGTLSTELTKLRDVIGPGREVLITAEFVDARVFFDIDDLFRFDANRNGSLHHDEVAAVLAQFRLEWDSWFPRFTSEVDQVRRTFQ